MPIFFFRKITKSDVFKGFDEAVELLLKHGARIDVEVRKKRLRITEEVIHSLKVKVRKSMY